MDFVQATLGKDEKGINIQIGFLAYRDIQDGHLRFEKKDFTGDIDDITKFISNLKATGGGDEAEDVIGALTKMRDEF